MSIKRNIITLVAVLTTATCVWANDLVVYPVKNIFRSFKIDNPIYEQMYQQNKTSLLTNYNNGFRSRFKNAINEITDSTKYKTYAVYVTVPRASKYEPPAKKQGSEQDVYCPVTMNINFVNIVSGETLYTAHKTAFSKLTFDSDVSDDIKNRELAKTYKEDTEKLITELLNQSSKEFKPFDISTCIIDVFKNIYVLDKGAGAGIAKGNILINEKSERIKVIYSDKDYSIAKNMLGNAQIGDVFHKFSLNNSVEQVQKPKILFFNDFANDKFYSIFSGALGNDTKFSLMTMDDSYQVMQRLLPKLNNDFDDAVLEERDMPDYLLKLYLSKPAYAKYKTEKSYIENDKYGMVACGVIFDKTGRVVYSTCADDETNEEVKADYRLDKASHFEVTEKNVLLKLANAMKNNIQFQDVVLKIQKSDEDFIYLLDPNGYLKKGLNVTVFKTVKPEKLNREILVPTWDYKVINIEKGIAVCKPIKSYATGIKKPCKSDVVKMAVISSTSSKKANLFNYIPDNIELEGNEFVIPQREFEGVAFAALSSTLQAPIAVPDKDFESYLSNMSDRGFKRNINIAENSDKLSLSVSYKIVKKSEKFLNKGKIINRQYVVTVNLIGKKDNTIIKQKSANKIIQIVVPKLDNEDITRYEMLKTIYPLVQQLASKF